MLEQRVCKAQKTPLQQSPEASNLNPIVAVMPFVAQALQRWQKWYLSGQQAAVCASNTI